jgi:hypothetical protein
MKSLFVSNVNGSALVETAVSLVVVITLVSSGFLIIYFSFARVWIARNSYEALICLATTTPERVCQRELRRTLERTLPFGSLSGLDLKRTSRSAKVHLRLTVGNNIILTHDDSLKLPLKTRGGP